jgi:murein DD-endopeptidase MepM/ murein hydrolase activator NlpD
MQSSFTRLSNIIPILLVAGVIIMASSGCVMASAAKEPDTLAGAVSLSSTDVANGQAALLEIDLNQLGPAATDLKAKFRDQSIVLIQHPIKSRGIYAGLVGIPLSATPEKAVIMLEWTDTGGRQAASVPLDIIDGKYKSEALSVDSRHVTLSKKNLARVKQEKKEIRRIFTSSSDARLWFGDFKRPLASETTSAFGTQRLFNGQHRSYHRGTDFRANVGTPVYASNSGVVRMARNLFYSGNMVIVDHGINIFTLYAHLSEIQVADEQIIARGQQIGLSGATGRVSGPHLHWSVKVNGVYVDPLQFLIVISTLLGR